ncbi:hypothetical protein X943_002152 [Babesia divergens]|uniref:Uncharacterized protein n=1 Tax=Babesia divergens TaxID=32595 RepID=A0AAD9LH24_BABDI|nr:hypothetical protein X943_002152 [Babesia divergens]
MSSFDAATTASVYGDYEGIIQGARFNQDSSCLAVYSNVGFGIYNCNPFAWACERNLSNRAQAGIHTVEMMYRCNIIGIVGAMTSNMPSTNYEDGSTIPWHRNVLVIWDDKKGREVAHLIFSGPIKNVKLLRKLVIVALDTEIYVYQLKNVELLNTFSTCYNPEGLCSVATNGKTSILAYPALEQGRVDIQTYLLHPDSDVIEHGKPVSIKAHTYDICNISLAFDGSLLTTISVAGGFVRLWNLFTGQKLHEFKIPSKCGRIRFCQISQDARYLLTISTKDVLSIFRINRSPSCKMPCSRYLSDCKFTTAGLIMKMVERTRLYFQSPRAFAKYKANDTIIACTFLPNTNNILLVLGDKTVVRLGISGQFKLLAKHSL